jgi:hypothetical protein
MQDLWNLARILNISYFTTEEASREERSFLALTTRIRKLQKSRHDQTSNKADDVLRNSIQDMIDKVAQVRHNFNDCIIRRDLTSKGEGGTGTITGMKPVWEEKAWLKPSSMEEEYLQKIEEFVKKEIPRKVDFNLIFQSSVRLPSIAMPILDEGHKELLLEAVTGRNQRCRCPCRHLDPGCPTSLHIIG